MKNPILTYIKDVPIRRNFVENLPYNPDLKVLVKEKRKSGILSEVIFWKQVRAGLFFNIDFDRQRIIGNYIVDFYVKTLGLVVEIDSPKLASDQAKLTSRKIYLESLHLKLFTTTDFAVKNNLPYVMKDLEHYIIANFTYQENHPDF